MQSTEPKKLKIILICIVLASFSTFLKSQDSFLINDSKYLPSINKINQKKFSLEKFSFGAFAGINFSQVVPLERSSIFSGSGVASYDKDYELFYKNIGSQMGFMLNYNFSKIISLGFYPLLSEYIYRYKNTYQWSGNTNLIYEASIAHHLNFFELPLILGFHTTFKKWQPYYQGGIFYGLLKGAKTNLSVIETSSNLSGSEQSIKYSTAVSSSDQYARNHYGLIAGAGVAYVGGGIKVGLEANMRFFLSNLNSIESRYQNNVIVSGNYDVPDKFKLSNLSINLCISMPLVCKNQNNSSGSLFCQ